MTSADSDGSAAAGRTDTTEVVRRRPRGTPFAPGQSGNPRGRPKGARNLNTIIAAALREQVTVRENDRTKRITKLEAAIRQLVNRAACRRSPGDARGHRARRSGSDPRREARHAPPRDEGRGRDRRAYAPHPERSMTDALSDEEVDAALRNDFYSFMVRCFRDLNTGPSLPALLACRGDGGEARGGSRRPDEAADRQHSAAPSEIARRLGRAARLAARPRSDAAIVNVTYGQELSDKFARDCRAVMTAAWYQRAVRDASCLGPRRRSRNW